MVPKNALLCLLLLPVLLGAPASAEEPLDEHQEVLQRFLERFERCLLAGGSPSYFHRVLLKSMHDLFTNIERHDAPPLQTSQHHAMLQDRTINGHRNILFQRDGTEHEFEIEPDGSIQGLVVKDGRTRRFNYSCRSEMARVDPELDRVLEECTGRAPGPLHLSPHLSRPFSAPPATADGVEETFRHVEEQFRRASGDLPDFRRR